VKGALSHRLRRQKRDPARGRDAQSRRRPGRVCCGARLRRVIRREGEWLPAILVFVVLLYGDHSTRWRGFCQARHCPGQGARVTVEAARELERSS
jgi:hypothetical protein